MQSLSEGDKFVIEFFQGDLLEELDVAQFTSGVCFLNLQAAVNKIEKKKKKLNSKDDDDAYPYAPQSNVDLSKVKLEQGDLLIYNNKKDHFAYLEKFLASKLQKH